MSRCWSGVRFGSVGLSPHAASPTASSAAAARAVFFVRFMGVSFDNQALRRRRKRGPISVDSVGASLYAQALIPDKHMAASHSTPEPTPEVTVLLRAWGHGDEAAGELLFPILYAELRRQAGRHMRRE